MDVLLIEKKSILRPGFETGSIVTTWTGCTVTPSVGSTFSGLMISDPLSTIETIDVVVVGASVSTESFKSPVFTHHVNSSGVNAGLSVGVGG